ncbi:SusC/RagA family TonB-linked outer membrane protein [Mucilaginibacter sp.]
MNFTTFLKAALNVLLNLQLALTRLRKGICRNPMLFKSVIIRVNIIALITAITLMQASAAVYTHKISLVERNVTITSNNSFTINGKVSDEKNQPLPGVSVKIKGTAIGTVTDVLGNYTIKANNGDVLVFSFIGFVSQEITIGGQTGNYNIQLKDDPKALSEVVVTALNIKKEKKSLTYALQTVDGEILEKVKTPTAIGGLVGQVAGLDIQTTTSFFQSPGILLRGQTPLIVIDGVPDPTADPYKINADDIESITVLKGAAGAALYGSMGINGAILYTTKRGKKGVTEVEFNSSTMFQTGFLAVPKVQTQYGDGNNGVYSYVDGSGDGLEGGGWVWGPALNQKDPNTASGYLELPQYNSPYNPNVTYTYDLGNGTTATSHYKPLPWISRGANNIANFFQTGVMANNSVAITTSGDKGYFRVSFANNFQAGVEPNTSLNNSSFTIAGNYNLTPKLTLDGRISYNRQSSDNIPSTGYSQGSLLYNVALWMGADVDIRDLKNYWAPGETGLQQSYYNLSYYNNPYFLAYQQLNGYHSDKTFGNLSLNYQFSKDLSLKLRSGFNANSVNEDEDYPYSYIGGNPDGNFSTSDATHFDITTDLILSYKHKISDNFNLSAIAGASSFFNEDKGLSASTDGLSIPGQYYLSNSINPITGSNYLDQRQINSLYADLDLELYHFIYLSGTARRDQTSTLPLENNAFIYPSVGVSAVLSEAFKLPEVISYLKVRSTWAMVNSGAISSTNPYASINTYNNANKFNGVSSLSYPTSYDTPDLIPNTVQSWESGLALGLLKNRLNADVTYFRNLESNNFQNVTPSQASGYSSLLVNANEFLNKGLEFVLNGTPIKTSNFQWTSGFNFSNNHTWIKKVSYDTYGPGYYNQYLKVGDRLDKLYVSEGQFSADGKLIVGSNGYPLNALYSTPMGDTDPNWIYGWQNTFNYKNISLSVSLDGRLGGLQYSTVNQKMAWGGTALSTVNQYRVAANAGQSTYIVPGEVVVSGNATYDSHGNLLTDTRKYAPNTTPVNYISYMESTSGAAQNNYFYYSGTYLKLRSVSLTYTFSKKMLSKQKAFKSASVSLVGNNLLLFSKLPNADPDTGADSYETPSTRSIGFNFNLKF